MEQVPTQTTFDAIVVGSGIAGGWAAKELTEQGLRVLLLESGHPIRHVKDYPTAHTEPWEFRHGGRLTEASKAKFPIQNLENGYPIGEDNEHFWLSECDHPYQQEQPFDWYRNSGEGGRSLLWGRHVYRWSDLNFEENAKEGIGIDWPIRYKDLEPWYAYVERFIGVSGEALGLSHIPDSVFQPAMPLNCQEEAFRKAVATHFPERVVTSGRVAHLTAPTPEQLALGRVSCQYRNRCSRGCPYGAYFSTQAATLPAAQRTGRLTIRAHTVVREVVYDTARQQATGVQAIDTQTQKEHFFKARLIFLAASAVGSTKIMLESVSARFPKGLGNDSGVLGHYLMDHQSRVGAVGTFSSHLDKYYKGRKPNGLFIPRYQNIGTDRRHFLRGFDYQGSATRPQHFTEGWGAGWKDTATRPGPWQLALNGFGEILPYADNRLYLHPELKDAYGLPQVVFDARLGANEEAMRPAIGTDAAEMLERSGAKEVQIINKRYVLGLSKHEMGTARMGHSPKDSVLNKHNQVWGCPNVFVTDGACMTSGNCINPSLTYMALTARACAHAVDEMKRGNI